MRNIVQYPILEQEVLDALNVALTVLAKSESYSYSVYPFVLQQLHEILEARPSLLTATAVDINNAINTP